MDRDSWDLLKETCLVNEMRDHRQTQIIIIITKLDTQTSSNIHEPYLPVMHQVWGTFSLHFLGAGLQGGPPLKKLGSL